MAASIAYCSLHIQHMFFSFPHRTRRIQRAHDVNTMLYGRRFNVLTSEQCPCNIVLTSLAGLEVCKYIFWILIEALLKGIYFMLKFVNSFFGPFFIKLWLYFWKNVLLKVRWTFSLLKILFYILHVFYKHNAYKYTKLTYAYMEPLCMSTAANEQHMTTLDVFCRKESFM